jgi:hypothetical protein
MRNPFGWDYPPGCSSLPWDDEEEGPILGEIVSLNGKKGIVVGLWTTDDDKVPEWANEEDELDVLVLFQDEDEPIAVYGGDLILGGATLQDKKKENYE